MERTVGKYKKPRKPMSEKNRIQAAERLKEAREKRLRENPPKYTNIHPSVRALPDDHVFSRVNVTKWIKTQKEIAASERRNAVKNVKGAIAKEHAARGYINNMNHYIQHGDWISDYYGEYEQHKITWVSITRSG